MSYLLGVSAKERRRLEFQDKVWGPVTAAMLDRLGPGRGRRALDVGAGVGLVSEKLRERGWKVTCVEPSAAYAALLRQRGFDVVEASIDELAPGGARFDLITCRWVFLFIADLEPRVARLARLLKKGGRLAVEDYHDYHGMALYPRGAAFEELTLAARRWFIRNGGDLRVAGRLPAAMRKAGLRVEEFRPNVLAGGGRSDVFKWAGLFFLEFARKMAGPALARRYAREWEAARRDPDARFVSPTVFDVIARAPR